MLALGAAAIAILVRQWLNFHEGHIIYSPEQSLRIWHIRHKGLDEWQVPRIIASLPILLQIALALFLTGMVMKLWPLDQEVARVLAVQLAILWAFFLFTLITPLIYKSCPYKSPQALLPLWLICVADSCLSTLPSAWRVAHSILDYSASLRLHPREARKKLLNLVTRWFSDASTTPLVQAVRMSRFHTPDWIMLERQRINTSEVSQLVDLYADADAICMDDSLFVDTIAPVLKKNIHLHQGYNIYGACERILDNRRCWPRNPTDFFRIQSAFTFLDSECFHTTQELLLIMFEELMQQQKTHRGIQWQRRIAYTFYVLQQGMDLMPKLFNEDHVRLKYKSDIHSVMSYSRKDGSNTTAEYVHQLLTVLYYLTKFEVPVDGAIRIVDESDLSEVLNATHTLKANDSNVSFLLDACRLCFKFWDIIEHSSPAVESSAAAVPSPDPSTAGGDLVLQGAVVTLTEDLFSFLRPFAPSSGTQPPLHRAPPFRQYQLVDFFTLYIRLAAHNRIKRVDGGFFQKHSWWPYWLRLTLAMRLENYTIGKLASSVAKDIIQPYTDKSSHQHHRTNDTPSGSEGIQRINLTGHKPRSKSFPKMQGGDEASSLV